MKKRAFSLLLFVLLASPSWAALSLTELTSDKSTVDATSFATASVTFSANALCQIAVFSRQAASSTVPTVTGDGVTFVELGHTLQGSTNRTVTWFRGLVASPSPGALTIDFAGNTQTECAWSVWQITGVDTSGTNGSGAIVQNATPTTGTGTATSLTLSAFGSVNNMAVAVNSHDSNSPTTQTSGFSLIDDVTLTENAQALETEYLVNTTGIAASWSGSQLWGCMAIEVKAATSSYLGILEAF